MRDENETLERSVDDRPGWAGSAASSCRRPADALDTRGDAELSGDLAHSRAPRPTCAAHMAAPFSLRDRWRPSFVPASLARARPARTRSLIMLRSNSANTPNV
jgi:hypothetical protein